MVNLIVRCVFCGKRHVLESEDAELWFTRCSCGARGFTQDETELADGEYRGAGFIVHEFRDSVGRTIHLSDPLPVTVNESGSWVFVFWIKEDEGLTV